MTEAQTMAELDREVWAATHRCAHGFLTRCPVTDSYACEDES